MKIEGSGKPAATFVKPSKGTATGKATAAGGDDVQLSPLAAELGSVEDAPAFDAARVSEIKQAIAEGRFKINTATIADRLIASAKELVDSQRQV
jgi:negative regulator of flagellin synthesis FlgM